MLIYPGYIIRETLYESNNSLIYRADREADKCPVILKTLKEEYPSPDRIVQFKREYEIAHSLNSGSIADEAVTGVAAAYRLERYLHSFVIILEDIGGISLDRWLISERASLKHNDLSIFLLLAIRITEALSQIHQRHIIHKNINPSNIVFNVATGQVKIIDFGIAASVIKKNPSVSNPNVLEGTLAYISPEQTGRLNRTVDCCTDLYSLGATFYELLTGQVPFLTDDVLELVHCHIARKPAAPHELKPDIPKVVSDIVLKLLSKDAEDRYQSAHGLLADLEECLREWMKAGHIESFLLGQQDISDRFRIPQKLYGRKQEIETLLAAFERTCAGMSEMMLVSGYAGIGKTVLVKEIHKPVTQRSGYFIAGKFDQFQDNIPYSALIKAFQSLIRQLLTESEAAIVKWREKLKGALGPNGMVIVNVLPDVELIIGPQPAMPALSPAEAQNRFRLVFQNFIRVFTQPEHPLVIFLDDLQWADGASLKLIELLITAPDNQCLFLIGAYRDIEVYATHPFILTREEIIKAGVTVNNIALGPLNLTNVTFLIADTLRCIPDLARPLAELAKAKTDGNPYFLREFLQNLYEEGLIVFDFHHSAWQWELGQIQVHCITDNVIELIEDKTQQMWPETQHALKLAACIGNVFNLKTLAYAYEKSPDDTVTDLWPAVTAGLVLPLSTSSEMVTLGMQGLADDVISEYIFTHDRVQQAVYSLISQQERPAMHLQIGQMQLQNTSPSEREARIFDIVNQLNRGRSLITDQAARTELAGLNLLAGKKAKTSTAYESAFSYLQAGMDLLGKEGWETQYSMILALHVEAAEAAYLAGDFESMERLVEEVLKRAKTLIDKVHVYEIKIQASIAQNKPLEAVRIALPVLKLLGVGLPKKPNKMHVLFGLLKTKMALTGKKIEGLINLPAMTEPYKLAAMRIMTKIGSATYIAAPDLMPLIAFKGITLSIKYGTAPESAFAYVAYGLILCGEMGDIEYGYRFGRLAASLVEQPNARELKTRTLFAFNAFIRHWKEPLQETIAPLREGYLSGLESGDLEFAARCIHSYCTRSLFVGRRLEDVERDMTVYSGVVRQLKQESPLRFFDPFHQIVLKLIGQGETPQRIDSESFTERGVMKQDQEKDRILVFYTCLSQLILSYLSEQVSQSIEYANESEKYSGGALASMHDPLFRLYDSLSRMSIYASSPKPEQKRILKRVAANQKRLSKWAHHAPMNNMHKFCLVEAERSRILGRYGKAEEYYDEAIKLAHENEFLNEEALAYELAGKFYLARGRDIVAHGYLQAAHYAYLRWGALGKARDIETRYHHVLAPAKTSPAFVPSEHIRALTTQRQDVSALDLISVIKASQAISGEIVLNRLITKLMAILIENAGAQRGFLVLEKNGQWDFEKEGAASIINYVARTHETVVLPDATYSGPFTHDLYIISQQPKSIICMPLLHQGKLRGILYLENNLMTNAFTPERLEVLHLLSSQMAISLTNALLYDELELHVQERTAELSETNVLLKQEINERKRAEFELTQSKNTAEKAHHAAEAANRAKSTFLANMSHEIRTPLNAIIGFTNLALETELSDKQRDYMQKIFISSRGLLGVVNDILDFSKIEAGKMELDHVDFDLRGIVDNLYSMFSDKAAGKGLKLSILSAEDVPSELVGDPIRLWQVLTNLINNAIKFTDSGEVTITIGIEKIDSQTARIRFVVRDTGIGISPEALTNIFDTFAQVDDSATRRFGGTGLGLSICKRLVEMMNGDLRVESTPGMGSTFYFTADFHRRAKGGQKKKEITPPDFIESLRGARVLLVEDNVINEQVAKEILEGAGLVVEVAKNGLEAVEAVSSHNYDAVLMDIQMPVMNGYEATRQIRSDPRHKDLPIIAITAYALGGASEECMAAGMNDFVVKPINRGELLSALSRRITSRMPARCDDAVAMSAGTVNQALGPVLPDILPGIDVSSGLERIGGNRKLFAWLLETFFCEYASSTDEIKAALNGNEVEKARRLVHTIRGVAGNISALNLYDAASELEKGIKQQIPDKMEGLLEVFDQALKQVLESIKCSASAFRQDQ